MSGNCNMSVLARMLVQFMASALADFPPSVGQHEAAQFAVLQRRDFGRDEGRMAPSVHAREWPCLGPLRRYWTVNEPMLVVGLQLLLVLLR